MKKIATIPLDQLRQALSGYPDDYKVSFSGLTFYRLKTRGPKLLQVEFEESVYRNEQGKLIVEEHLTD